MNRLVFVTTELHPQTGGGAGVLIADLARKVSSFRPVLIVLLSDEGEAVTVNDNLEVVVRPSAGSFLERSKAAAAALDDLARGGDRIEFHDFEGLGFWALAHRSELELARSPMTVRFHGPYDLISETLPHVPADWAVPGAMEAEAFRMADQVIIPVPGHTRTLVERYGVEPDRIVVGYPPVDPLGRIHPASHSSRFAVVGRLGDVKGSDLMVSAVVSLLEEGHDVSLRFIGADGWSAAENRPMSEALHDMIPDRYRSSFEFVPQTAKAGLSALLDDVLAVVVPSRFESFCLVAHEARRAGMPILVPAIPAFTGLFGEATGAMLFEPGTDDLADKMRLFLEHRDLAAKLAGAPPPAIGDPVGAYRHDPTIRHERAQAGLATAATQRLEGLELDQRTERRTLQKLYRYLPGPVAAIARRILPTAIKDRFRDTASWPAEQARRDLAERLETVMRRIREGRYPELENPDVTVVIPVYNDARFLDETLASVYEQTNDSWEIVVVDDGSDEPECVKALERLDRPRLRLVRQENRGLPGARNTGINHARGRFVIPLDADDELDERFVDLMLDALSNQPRAGFAHCYARLYHDVDAHWMTRPFNPYWQLLGNGVVGCVLLRKDAWENVGGYDESMTDGNEDWELWVRLTAAGWEQVQVPEVLFKYRKHGVSMSVETEARFEQGRRQVRDRHMDLYEKRSLQSLKRANYPLITLLSDARPDSGDDIEVIESPAQLESTWGKYVVDVRGLADLPLEAISRLADELESNPKAMRATTTAEVPLVMVRRWNLHDPTAEPSETIVVDEPTSGSTREMPKHLARSLWSPPADLLASDLPLQRMPPEEAGHLPDPASW